MSATWQLFGSLSPDTIVHQANCADGAAPKRKQMALVQQAVLFARLARALAQRDDDRRDARSNASSTAVYEVGTGGQVGASSDEIEAEDGDAPSAYGLHHVRLARIVYEDATHALGSLSVSHDRTVTQRVDFMRAATPE